MKHGKLGGAEKVSVELARYYMSPQVPLTPNIPFKHYFPNSFIFTGWWHLVVNLSPSLALTQNFIPPTQLAAAIKFLRDQPGSVSGFDMKKVKDPYGLFLQRMQKQYPRELQDALGKLERKKKTKWSELTDTKGQGFTFGFGGGGDSDDE